MKELQWKVMLSSMAGISFYFYGIVVALKILVASVVCQDEDAFGTRCNMWKIAEMDPQVVATKSISVPTPQQQQLVAKLVNFIGRG